MAKFTLNINGESHTVEAEADTPLLWVLRDHLGMVGTKYGCGMSLCGACTIHMNGTAVRSCITPVAAASTAKITTIEGLATDGKFTALQQAWCDHDVAQCGYCQSGQLMTATSLLKSNPNPSEAEIDQAMAGNICRCGTYARIRVAIKSAATAGKEAGAK